MKGQKALFSKNSDEWETPQWLFDLLDKEFHFECDAAATTKNTKCKNFFGEDYTGKKENSLVYDWTKCMFMDVGEPEYPKSFFLNPPHSKIAAFMKKAYEESLKGAVVVCLIPCRCDTRYWHDYIMKAQEIRFIKGRLKFNNRTLPSYKEDGSHKVSSATFPSCVVVFSYTHDHYWNQDTGYPLCPIVWKTIEAVKK